MKRKSILVICAHPDKQSLNAALAQAYLEELQQTYAQVEFLHLRDLDFNYNLEHGYNRRTELEPDLLRAQELIRWADHVVFFFPNWWGTYPAVLKAFLDRVLLPGFAFKYKDNSVWWDKLLKGKTARMVMTMHTPAWYYWLVYRQPAINALKKGTLEFCGFSPVKVTTFSCTNDKKHLPKDEWLTKIRKIALRDVS